VDYVLKGQSAVSHGSEHLPDFDDPPVVETVLSAQFEPLPALQTAQLGLLWGEYRTAFPKAGEHAPIDPVIEQFPERPTGRMALKLQTFENPPIPRLSFANEQGNEMIQVQNDRFIKNWRKEGDGEQYPRYDKTIRPNFDRDYRIFLAFLERNRFGAPRVNQCEVTYVNHILTGQGWAHYGDVDKLFTFWRSPDSTPPGPPEDLRLHARFIMPGESGKPMGRLHVDLQPAIRVSDNLPMYVLHLTARGQIGDGLAFFDVGREWIVKTFKKLTTESMHNIWRIKNSGNSGNC
jgi:uncharacterized protein (TIGR04255 family)